MALFNRKRDDEVVDVTDTTVEALRQRETAFEFGFPTKCPSCSGRGYLDHLDPHRKVQYEHCPSCSAKWERSEHDVLSLNA